MALFGAVLLVIVVLIRPQEFLPVLEKFQLLYVTTGLTVGGIVLERVMARRRVPTWTPQLPYLLAFLAWAFVCTLLGRFVKSDAGGSAADVWRSIGLSVIFMLAVSGAITSYQRYRTLAIALLAIGLSISAVCIHMAQQPAQCIVLASKGEDNDAADRSEGEPDGRACDTAWICEREGDYTKTYDCEKAGMFGTFTQGLRVRWRGTLGDPNELAVLIGAIVPFLFALVTIWKRVWVTLLVALATAVLLYCVVLTGSRGGQLVVLTVFGVYFVRRYGLKGLIVGGVFAIPVLMFGGRGGEEADSSSDERAQLLYMGMDMIKAYEPFGVGVGQFVEHSFNDLTAHNSYVLAAAEMGIPGSILWLLLVYVSMKIPYAISKRPPAAMDPRIVPFAYALLVSFAGILVGIFFLSFCYKQMLFIYFGLSGALYLVAKKADPTFEVKVSRKETIWLVVGDVALLLFVFVYSRIKGTG